MVEQRVVNTSPLIYLARAELLHLLRVPDTAVWVPHEVVAELHAWPTGDAAQLAVRTQDWLTPLSPISVPSTVLAWDLGAGESAVLAHAMANPGVVAVVDDLAARRCAASLGIGVRGSLGLVLDARKRGVIASARDTLQHLRECGMYLSDRIVEAALREIDE